MRRTIPRRFAFVLAAVAATAAFAPPAAAEPMTLDEVLRRARTRPEAAAAGDRARAADAAARIERRRALAPTVSAGASTTWRDRDFTLETPIGGLTIGDQWFTRSRVRVSQPLLDASRLFYAAPAAEADARAAGLAAAWTREELAADAAELFFDIVTADARLAAIDDYIASLEARLAQVRELVAVGRSVRADELRLALARDDARQQRLAVRERRDVARRALARAVGVDGTVTPVFDPSPRDERSARGGARALQSDLDAALANRDDLRALAARVDGAERRRRGVWSELVPRVELHGDYVWTDAGPQAEESFFEITVNLVWVPFAAGTRSQRARALAAERSALAHRLREAGRGVAVETRAARADLRVARGEVDLARRAVTEAEESRRVTVERYLAGRETINDVLDAEATLADRRARRRIAVIDRERAEVRLAAATGRLGD